MARAISVTTRGAETLAKTASKKASDRAVDQTAAQARHAGLIRYIFGNPFRPVALGAACHTRVAAVYVAAASATPLTAAAVLDFATRCLANPTSAEPPWTRASSYSGRASAGHSNELRPTVRLQKRR